MKRGEDFKRNEKDMFYFLFFEIPFFEHNTSIRGGILCVPYAHHIKLSTKRNENIRKLVTTIISTFKMLG